LKENLLESEHFRLLQGLGQGELDDVTAKNTELFICKLYNVSNITTVNKAREILFVKGTLRRRLSHGYFSFIAKYTSN